MYLKMLQQQPDRPSVIHIHPAVMCEHHILVRVEEEMLNEQEEQVGRQVQGQIEDEDVEQNEDEKGVKLHDRKMKQRHVEGEQRLRRALSSTDSLNIVIDCAYDDVHNEKEKRSLIRQIQESYGNLRKDRSDILTHLHIVNPPESVKETMEKWHITIHNSKEDLLSFLDKTSFIAPAKDSLVYLSPDASETLETVDTKKVYIIGGIVDKTVKKSISLSHAIREEIQCYRFPIREYISAQGSLALSIDACVQILLSYSQNRDWYQAFEQHLPDRKKQNRSLHPSTNTATSSCS